jgi:hypothetical protein
MAALAIFRLTHRHPQPLPNQTRPQQLHILAVESLVRLAHLAVASGTALKTFN